MLYCSAIEENNLLYNFVKIEKMINKDIEAYYACNNSFYSLQCGRNKTKYKFSRIAIIPHSSYISLSTTNNCLNQDTMHCSDSYMLIGILTRPECFYERMIFRKILKKYNYINYLFISGLSNQKNINQLFHREILYYNDILFFNISSSYFNCSIIMTCFYKNIFKKCHNIEWVMKLDIDTYVNIRLLNIVLNRLKKNESIIGSINKYPKIKCNSNGKWAITCKNTSKVYMNIPAYPFGPGFVFKFSALRCINEYISNNNKIIWIEDILFGIFMKYCNLTYLDISKYTDVTYRPKYNLSVAKYKIFVHGLYPIEILLSNMLYDNSKYI